MDLPDAGKGQNDPCQYRGKPYYEGALDDDASNDPAQPIIYYRNYR